MEPVSNIEWDYNQAKVVNRSMKHEEEEEEEEVVLPNHKTEAACSGVMLFHLRIKNFPGSLSWHTSNSWLFWVKLKPCRECSLRR